MRNGLLFLIAAGLFLIAGTAFAAETQDLGTFTCPAGQVEDTDCAKTCCENYGGTYSLSAETCQVETQADWPKVVACEQALNCCKSAGTTGTPGGYNNTPSPGGCCSTGFVLFGLLGTVVFGNGKRIV